MQRGGTVCTLDTVVDYRTRDRGGGVNDSGTHAVWSGQKKSRSCGAFEGVEFLLFLKRNEMCNCSFRSISRIVKIPTHLPLGLRAVQPQKIVPVSERNSLFTRSVDSQVM